MARVVDPLHPVLTLVSLGTVSRLLLALFSGSHVLAVTFPVDSLLISGRPANRGEDLTRLMVGAMLSPPSRLVRRRGRKPSMLTVPVCLEVQTLRRLLYVRR